MRLFLCKSLLMNKFYTFLAMMAVVISIYSCKKTNLPDPNASITKTRVWSGYKSKSLVSPLIPITNASWGKDAYHTDVQSVAITISSLNSKTLKVSEWNIPVVYRRTDSSAGTVTFDSSSKNTGAKAVLTYYYIGDSVTLYYNTYEGSEYGFDDPYSVSTYYVGK